MAGWETGGIRKAQAFNTVQSCAMDYHTSSDLPGLPCVEGCRTVDSNVLKKKASTDPGVIRYGRCF